MIQGSFRGVCTGFARAVPYAMFAAASACVEAQWGARLATDTTPEVRRASHKACLLFEPHREMSGRGGKALTTRAVNMRQLQNATMTSYIVIMRSASHNGWMSPSQGWTRIGSPVATVKPHPAGTRDADPLRRRGDRA